MKTFLLGVVASLVAIFAVVGAVGYSIVSRGLSARDEPSRVETLAARALRRAATPDELRGMTNPVPRSEAAIQDGLEHFADHCALCHGNDGRADNFYGRNMFPPPPDMTTATQKLSDGEIYAAIENGIRLTGMPSFGDGSPGNRASWNLVHFIRHLPQITPEELRRMEALNPKSPAQLKAEQEERDFLEGKTDSQPPMPMPSGDGHDHVH